MMLVKCSSSCKRRSQRRSSWRTCASRAPKGSSSSSTLGSTAMARASATPLLWPPDSCAGYRSAAPLELHQREQLAHLLADVRCRRPLAAALHLQAKGDIFEHGQVAEQSVMLKYESDLAVSDGPQRCVLAIEHDLTLVRCLEPRNDAQQRGLAASPKVRAAPAMRRWEHRGRYDRLRQIRRIAWLRRAVQCSFHTLLVRSRGRCAPRRSSG